MTDLAHISREGGGEFELALAAATPFRCREIVRRLPDRRLVCRGEWAGHAVYAKLFIGENAQRYADRDASGALALAKAGLLTPTLLHRGHLVGQKGEALVYAEVPEACNAEDLLGTAHAAQRLTLENELVRTVARHHAAGLLQTDLYPRNFLSTSAGIHTLDGDGIRAYPHPVEGRRALDNLALLASKFPVEDMQRAAEWLRLYHQAGGGEFRPQALLGRAEALRYRSLRAYSQHKVLRNCSEVRVVRSFSRFVAARRASLDADLGQAIADPDALLDKPECQRLKNGNTCTVGQVQAGERNLVIKRYNIKNLRHAIGRALRRSRAAVSWSNAHLLQAAGIATAPALALVERRLGPLRRQAWLLSDYVEGPEISAALAGPELVDLRKQQIAFDAAALLHRLYLLGIEHGDFKASNLKIVDGKPLLLDLDAMRLHRRGWWFRQRHGRDLRRFLKNWQAQPMTLALLQDALKHIYGRDPVLTLAGIRFDEQDSKSET